MTERFQDEVLHLSSSVDGILATQQIATSRLSLLKMHASIDQQFVAHLREASKSSEVYVCVLCKARIPNAGKPAFITHIESIHSNDLDAAGADLHSILEDLATKSRVVGYG